MAASGLFWGLGRVSVSLKLAGDFEANVAGAMIGGMISVSLAILMFRHERQAAKRDAAELARTQRSQAIREALRHVRAIRECVAASQGLTINNSSRLIGSLRKSCELTSKALENSNLTDFPLRLAMSDAVAIGADTAGRLEYDIRNTSLSDANTISLGAASFCGPALTSIDELIDDYTRIRTLPTLG